MATTADRLTALEARLDQLEAAAAEAPPLARDIDPGALVTPVLPPSPDAVALALADEAGQHRVPDAPVRPEPEPDPDPMPWRSNPTFEQIAEYINAR